MLPRMSLYLDLLSHLQVVVAIPRSGTARVFKCLNLNLNIKKYWVRNHCSFENFMQNTSSLLRNKQNKTNYVMILPSVSRGRLVDATLRRLGSEEENRCRKIVSDHHFPVCVSVLIWSS